MVERDIYRWIINRIERDEVLVITGARQVGKTTLMKEVERNLRSKGKATLFINLEDKDYLGMLNESPKNLLRLLKNEKTFVFVDEVQYLNDPSGLIKYIYDEHRDRIKLIVSGSSAFYMDRKFRDSLAGRKRLVLLGTFSFREFLRAKEKEGLIEQYDLLPVKREILALLEEYAIYGGYPRVVLEENPREKREILRELINSYAKKDALGMDIKEEYKFFQLMKLLAGRTGMLVNKSELSSTLGVSITMIDNYLYLMEKAFYVSFISPFYRNRTKEITRRKKVYFMDTGLRNALVNDFKPLEERNDVEKGQVVENLFFKMLLDAYSPEDIKFWRSKGGAEVDFVLEEKTAWEIKYRIKRKKYGDFEKKYGIKVQVLNFENLVEFYKRLMEGHPENPLF